MQNIFKLVVSASIGFLGFKIMSAMTSTTTFSTHLRSIDIDSIGPSERAKPGDVRDTVPRTILNAHPFPTLFVSHGGPTFLYENDDFGNKGAWHALRALGKTIKHEWKPDYIVVVSAHWQSSGSTVVEVGVPPKSSVAGGTPKPLEKRGKDWVENPLIYDFYGFPDHMYQEQFRSWNSASLSNLISKHLSENGFNSQTTERGIDHGVWVPLKVAFGDSKDDKSREKENDEGMILPETPIIQVSLTGVESDFKTHARLGEVLGHFQNNLIWDPSTNRYMKGLVICSGMTVHNLRDLGPAVHSGKKALPYVADFSRLVSEALQGPETLVSMDKLKSDHSQLLKSAHPTLEHFVPLVVAAGVNKASGNRKVRELYNDDMLSLAWGTYQFGDYDVV